MIKYIKGDATAPVGEGKKLIVHCCNDIGKWGAGFVLALSKKWKLPESCYLRWSTSPNFGLGQIQAVKVTNDITVINMIGQHKTKSTSNETPIKYEAIERGLIKINKLAVDQGATFHAPRFGAGLAGGSWKLIELLIKQHITVDVTIYDFG